MFNCLVVRVARTSVASAPPPKGSEVKVSELKQKLRKKEEQLEVRPILLRFGCECECECVSVSVWV